MVISQSFDPVYDGDGRPDLLVLNFGDSFDDQRTGDGVVLQQMDTEENQRLGTYVSPWRVSVAPMMDWTDRHCRYFHRLLSRHALLYTEMVTTGALVHGDVARHLRFNAQEHPVALQLGGSEPADLAHCAKLGEQWGYDEINL